MAPYNKHSMHHAMQALKIEKYHGVFVSRGLTLSSLASCSDAELAAMGLPIGEGPSHACCIAVCSYMGLMLQQSALP